MEVDTPFYKGQVTAVCMENPLCDVIMGNVANVTDDVEADELHTHTDQAGQEGHTVVTTAQAKKHEKPQEPFKVISNLGEDITRKKLITLQQQDMSLCKFIKEADGSQRDKKSEEYFTMTDGILYRYCKNFEGREISQVVVPKRLRDKVMTMAHDAVMSGHQGRKKTKDKIWREFWWPGSGVDVTRLCRSCEILENHS